jgi:hypothetical protein
MGSNTERIENASDPSSENGQIAKDNTWLASFLLTMILLL